MSKQLYEEALADVKKLKEVAEDNAKRALLEAVTPRIRDLIENQLLGELGQMPEEDPEKILTDDSLVAPSESSLEDAPVEVDPENIDALSIAVSEPDEEGKVTLDLDALRTPSGEYELSQEAAMKLGLLMNSGKKEKTGSLKFESSVRQVVAAVKKLQTASRLVKESKDYSRQVLSTMKKIEEMHLYLKNKSNTSSSVKKQLHEKTLKDCYSALRLMEQKMKRNRKNLTEAELTLKLTNIPDELEASLSDIGVDLISEPEEEGEEAPEEEGGDEDMELDDDSAEGEESEGDEESEESGGEGEDEDFGDLDLEEEGQQKMESRRLGNNVVVEIDENMLRREIGRMKALREAEETKAQSWGHGPGEVSDEFEDDDLGDPFVDIDLTTEQQGDKEDDKKNQYGEAEENEGVDELDEMDELDELEQSMDELDELEQSMDQAHGEDAEHGDDTEQPNDQSNEPGKTVESLRRRLRAETRLQIEAKQKAQKAQKAKQQAEQQAKQKQKQANEQQKKGQKGAAQKTKQEQQKKKQQAKKMQEAYNFYARKFNESVVRSRRLQGMLTEAVRKGNVINGATRRTVAEAADLRAKLAETNLFNAKLLYTNKLLQNESLTKRQKAEVIERLDEARNEREVKLVYESLTKALRGTSTRQLSESTNHGVIGSSSRPARTASPSTLNEGVEADRWARLAGIIK